MKVTDVVMKVILVFMLTMSIVSFSMQTGADQGGGKVVEERVR